MTDKCYCNEHGVRGEKIEHLKETDTFICKKIERETAAREAEYKTIADALRLMGERIDRYTPRWAFLALLSVLIVVSGYGGAQLTQVNNKLSVFSEKMRHLEESNSQVLKRLERNSDRIDKFKYPYNNYRKNEGNLR